ncbi:hypothetical protein BABINDRAFT_164496 [Babjeviella inositovora NRRL Y-12698]|uniref:U6 snRNA-associated Sm-like protein LSm1 n=1 Tax=Babjeviella inositovora NRRL Y-12698 TaxID=984486 RepID=A0A1E3QYQ0_9ASCO|nr:uncharacterized protein BABINDRAFT_164496 [Babjeviella inositovora NRRL Y-12698]ODQ82756.1 hypothetical protein BABINDRAFT_164496 [Babjeviella inositovora NRRL Y-12698]
MSQAQIQQPHHQQQPNKNVDALSQGVEDLYLESYAFTTAAGIVGSVDRKVFVLLRDGRNLFGILRTFDQYANLVLQDTIERIYLPNNRYAEADRGVFLIRGENVVMLGELDIDKEDTAIEEMVQMPFNEADKEWEALNAERIKLETQRAKKLLKVSGLTSDFVKSDLY